MIFNSIGAIAQSGGGGGTTKFWMPLDENSTTTFTDRISGNSVTVEGAGTNTASTSSPPGSVSRYQNIANDGAKNYQVTSPTVPAGDLTVEMFMRMDSIGGGTGNGFRITDGTYVAGMYGDGATMYLFNGGNLASGAHGMSDGVWYHWCIMLNNATGDGYMFINGSQIATGNSSNFSNLGALTEAYFGYRSSSDTGNANGFGIGQCRISSALLYATGGFTAPTPPLE